MGLPPAAPSRQLKHRRPIDVEVFARDDGLWEVDARQTGTKASERQLASGHLPAGAAFRHALHARMGGILGCTHLTEMAQVLPSAVSQALANEVIDVNDANDAIDWADGNSTLSRPQVNATEPALAPFQRYARHALRRHT